MILEIWKKNLFENQILAVFDELPLNGSTKNTVQASFGYIDFRPTILLFLRRQLVLRKVNVL